MNTPRFIRFHYATGPGRWGVPEYDRGWLIRNGTQTFVDHDLEVMVGDVIAETPDKDGIRDLIPIVRIEVIA